VQNGTLIFNGSNTNAAINATSASGTINADINLWRSPTNEYWTVGSGNTLTIGGSIDFTGHNLYVEGGGGTVVFDGTNYTGDQFGLTDYSVATFNSGDLTTTSAVLAGSDIVPDDAGGTINWNSAGTLTPGALLAVGQNADGVFTQSNGIVDTTASGCTFAIGSSGSSSTTNVYNLNGGVLKARSPAG